MSSNLLYGELPGVLRSRQELHVYSEDSVFKGDPELRRELMKLYSDPNHEIAVESAIDAEKYGIAPWFATYEHDTLYEQIHSRAQKAALRTQVLEHIPMGVHLDSEFANLLAVKRLDEELQPLCASEDSEVAGMAPFLRNVTDAIRAKDEKGSLTTAAWRYGISRTLT